MFIKLTTAGTCTGDTLSLPFVDCYSDKKLWQKVFFLIGPKILPSLALSLMHQDQQRLKDLQALVFKVKKRVFLFWFLS